MAGIIFGLVIVYGFYVIYSAISNNQTVKGKKAKKTPFIFAVRLASSNEENPLISKKKTTAKNSSSVIEKIASGTLRNPKTGEVAKIASSYRMCKRWIKEALVTEGLLKNVYKTGEVDDVEKVKINMAMYQLSQMEKYQ